MKKFIATLALALGLAGTTLAMEMPRLSLDLDRVAVMDGPVDETVGIRVSDGGWSFAFGGLNNRLDWPMVVGYDFGTPVALPVLGNLHVSSDSRFDFIGVRGERVLPLTEGLGAHVGLGLVANRHDILSTPDVQLNLGFELDLL